MIEAALPRGRRCHGNRAPGEAVSGRVFCSGLNRRWHVKPAWGGQGEPENRLPGSEGDSRECQGPRGGGPRPGSRGRRRGGTMVSRHGCHSGLWPLNLAVPTRSAGLGRLPLPPPPPKPPLPPGSHGDQSLLRTLGWEPPSPLLAPGGTPVGGPALDPQPLFLALCSWPQPPLPTLGLSSQGPG